LRGLAAKSPQILDPDIYINLYQRRGEERHEDVLQLGIGAKLFVNGRRECS
jgi:hypothetical protein